MNKSLLYLTRCLLALFCTMGVQALFAQNTIVGTVTDQTTGQPVAGATILVSGTQRGAASDAAGAYEIRGLADGTYTLDVSMIAYEPKQIPSVEVRGGTVRVDIVLAEQSEQISDVVVTAVRRTGSEVAVNREVREAMMVVSAVSSQTISKTQDRDAGEVVRRIPGISLIDDKFIIARGLSQRYNNVWVNNAAVPSSEADSRAFSFDIIPAGQIENIMILKSPVPEVPADFTGGFIKIATKDMPSTDESVSINYSMGINTATHFGAFYYNPGFAGDYVGFGSGARMMQGGMTGAYDNDNASFVSNMTRNGFNNNWSVRKRSAVPDQRLSASFGRTWRMKDGDRLALTGAVNYSYVERAYTDMENSRFGVYNKREDKPEYLYKYTDDQYQTNVKVGAMLNLAYVQEKSRYYFRNLFNQIGQSRYTWREGWQNISSLYNQEKAEYLYTSRTSYNGQFAGVHTLGSGRLDWSAGYAYADKHLPDRRIINRQQNDIYGDEHYGEMQIDQNEMQRDFTKLVEHIASAGVNYTQTFREGSTFAPQLRAGLYGEYRTREYRARSFYYRYNASNLPSDFVYGDPVSEILTDVNYAADKLYLYDDSDNRNSYDGRNLLAAAYVGVNLPIGAVDIYAGVRFEHSDMTLTSYTRSDEWLSKDRSYTYDDLFPSVNATYKISEQHQLRAAYGMSTNRPEFREVSASTFYDFDLFSMIMGNPDLTAAYIHNADLRYEWYPSAGENISLSLFYKHFRHPIETTIRDAGGSYTYTFENADRARAYGVELDVRKNLDFMGMRDFSLSLNVSLIESRVFFDSSSLEHDRPMQGQSPYIVNCGLFWQPQRAGMTLGVLYNRIGKRIIGIGRTDLSSGGSVDNDIPDMYEMPRDALDLVVTKRLGKRWELRLSLKDLICDKVELCQFPQFTDDAGVVHERKEVTKTYDPGRSFTIGASVKF